MDLIHFIEAKLTALSLFYQNQYILVLSILFLIFPTFFKFDALFLPTASPFLKSLSLENLAPFIMSVAKSVDSTMVSLTTSQD